DHPETAMCTVVALDHTNLFYTVCSICERIIPEKSEVSCGYCKIRTGFNRIPRLKRLFRVLLSVATDAKVSVVIMFDKSARVLFGCSADEFFDFAKTHPYAAMAASRALQGEMLTVTLSNPKTREAQHLRVSSVVPMQTGFRPVMETLRLLYHGRGGP
ncbi:hypothetical protein M569_11494, partial [Genlisea aurea]